MDNTSKVTTTILGGNTGVKERKKLTAVIW